MKIGNLEIPSEIWIETQEEGLKLWPNLDKVEEVAISKCSQYGLKRRSPQLAMLLTEIGHLYTDKKGAFLVTIGPDKYKIKPSGIYKAKLINMEDTLGPRFRKPAYKFKFEISEPGLYQGTHIETYINKTQNDEKGKIAKLVRALAGVSLKQGESLNLRELLNKECLLNVVLGEDGKSNVITEFYSIEELHE